MSDNVEEEPVQEEFGSAMRLLASLIDAPCPVGLPLTAKYKQGFAFKTIGHRLPVILTKAIDQLYRDKNDIAQRFGEEAREEVKTIVGSLAKLKNEMQTNKPLSRIGCPQWDNYLEIIAKTYFGGKVDGVRWYFVPWMYAECYMYERVHQAFMRTQLLKTLDVFQKQKEEGWFASEDAAVGLGEFLKNSQSNEENAMDALFLEVMLEISLWGNRCDMSLSGGELSTQSGNILDQLAQLKDSILCDDALKFWTCLQDKKTAANSKDTISLAFIVDNAGFELFTDLCFADALMSNKVDRIDFHVKVIPWFVSDALAKDVTWLLETMASAEGKPILNTLASKWKGYFHSKIWRIVESPFWTYPYVYSDMAKYDQELHSHLSQNTLLIFKGDLNYRKLIGDVNWPPETPFKDSLQSFCSSPLLALRTLKADCVSGLEPSVVEAVSHKSPDWMVTGEYGLIQFAN